MLFLVGVYFCHTMISSKESDKINSSQQQIVRWSSCERQKKISLKLLRKNVQSAALDILCLVFFSFLFLAFAH